MDVPTPLRESGADVLPTATILIVDDTAVNRLILTRETEKLGHCPLETRDGMEALKVLASEFEATRA